jgi:hypothetical protein
MGDIVILPIHHDTGTVEVCAFPVDDLFIHPAILNRPGTWNVSHGSGGCVIVGCASRRAAYEAALFLQEQTPGVPWGAGPLQVKRATTRIPHDRVATIRDEVASRHGAQLMVSESYQNARHLEARGSAPRPARAPASR